MRPKGVFASGKIALAILISEIFNQKFPLPLGKGFAVLGGGVARTVRWNLRSRAATDYPG